MSTIFAYAGEEPCRDILLEGVAALSSNQQEPAGAAFLEDGALLQTKSKDGAAALSASKTGAQSHIGLAAAGTVHRCKPSAITAPPALNDRFAVVCAGVIENFEALKAWLRLSCPVATDEDLLLAMLGALPEEGNPEKIHRLLPSLQGNPSYAFIDCREEAVYAHCGDDPLALGIGKSGYCLSSELKALIPFAQRYFYLEQGESLKITPAKITVFDAKMKRIKKQLVALPVEEAVKPGSLLRDTLFYAPLAAREVVNRFTNGTALSFDALKFTPRRLDRIRRVILTGSGSAYASARLGAYYFEMMSDTPCCAYAANELRWGSTLFDKDTLVIALSDSGEDREAYFAVQRAKAFKAQTLAICSHEASLLAITCDNALVIPAVHSMPVAAITRQLSLSLFILYIGTQCGIISELYAGVALKLAELLPGKLSVAVKEQPHTLTAAQQLLGADILFVTGVGADTALAAEAARSIRSLTGLHATAEPASELAFEMPSLLAQVTVLALLTNREMTQKITPFLRRIQSLGGHILLVTSENIENELTEFETVLSFPDSIPLFDAVTCLGTVYKIALTAGELLRAEQTEQEAV